MSEDEKPKLKCRMYEARLPVEGSIVMGKVTDIVGNEAAVYLVEYRKKSKLILSAVVPPIRVLTPKRLEAFRVLQVNIEAGEILLDENPLPLSDIWAFETRYNEAKFVQSVIFSVADDLNMDLKEAYKLAGWPDLKRLKNLYKDEDFTACENTAFRTLLIDRAALMRHTSWRIKDPSRLQTCSLNQLHDICYAIALTRQGEAFFKNKGNLPKESSLSIQDVFNKALESGFVERDWTLSELVPLVKILKRDGYVLDEDCPLTYSRKGFFSDSDEDSIGISTCCSDPHCDITHSAEGDDSESGDSNDSDDGPKSMKNPRMSKLDLKVPQMRVLTTGTDAEGEDMTMKVLNALEVGPLTCSVFMFPSYESVRKDVIFEPTVDEKLVFEKDNGRDLDLHTMLLTGDGVDRKGKHYLEFQDCLGDVNNGDRGFVRFAVKPNTISECVIFKDYY